MIPPPIMLPPIAVKTPVIVNDCMIANRLPAATLPSEACQPAAIDPSSAWLAALDNMTGQQHTCDRPNCTESNRGGDSDNNDSTNNHCAGECVVFNPVPDVAASVEGVLDTVLELLQGGASGLTQEPGDYLESGG